MAESVSKFANDVILPKVRSMDENEKMDQDIIEQCFEQGLMSIEIPEEFGGAGMNFTAAIVGIEELAKVDPSVSVMVDVHNTLVNTTLLKYGTKESQRKWLPQLATNTVGKSRTPSFSTLGILEAYIFTPKVPSVSLNPSLALTPSPSKPAPKRRQMATASTAPKCGSQTL